MILNELPVACFCDDAISGETSPVRAVSPIISVGIVTDPCDANEDDGDDEDSTLYFDMMCFNLLGSSNECLIMSRLEDASSLRSCNLHQIRAMLTV